MNISHITNLNSGFTFRGSYPEISKFVNQGVFNLGDVVLCGEDSYVFNGDSWVKLAKCDNLSVETEPLPKLTEIKCSCCGAPLPHMTSKHTSMIKCEYCGSIYSW